MITVIIKRSDEPKVIQLTQQNIMRELVNIPGSEMLLEDSWREGLKKVRTMYVCLVEADCTLSASYLSSNYGILDKSLSKGREGGNVRLAMLASCLGVDRFDNRIYNYRLSQHIEAGENISIKSWQVEPARDKISSKPYNVQVGFVPGAIIRYNSIKDIIDTFDWDNRSLTKLSTDLSFHFWNTNRVLKVNPNTTYVSTQDHLEKPPPTDTKVPDKIGSLFQRLGL